MDESIYADYMSFDVVLKSKQSKIGYVTRKMIFPLTYTEEDVRLDLEKKQPDLLVADIFESEYVMQLK